MSMLYKDVSLCIENAICYYLSYNVNIVMQNMMYTLNIFILKCRNYNVIITLLHSFVNVSVCCLYEEKINII